MIAPVLPPALTGSIQKRCCRQSLATGRVCCDATNASQIHCNSMTLRRSLLGVCSVRLWRCGRAQRLRMALAPAHGVGRDDRPAPASASHRLGSLWARHRPTGASAPFDADRFAPFEGAGSVKPPTLRMRWRGTEGLTARPALRALRALPSKPRGRLPRAGHQPASWAGPARVRTRPVLRPQRWTTQ
jgi:hypothetical protein